MRLFALVALIACGGDKSTGSDPNPGGTSDEPTGTTDRTGDSGESSASGWRPDSFTVFSQFGVDDGRLRTWRIDDVEYAPFVALELWEDGSDADSERCTVYLVIDDPVSVSLEVWSWDDDTEEAAGQSMQHLGFIVPDDARVETDGCEGVDTDAFGDPGENIASHLWGVGVGGLRVDVEARFEEEITEGFWSDAYASGNLFGGSWNSDVWEPAIWGSHIAVAAELGADGTLEADEFGQPTPLLESRDVLSNPAAIPDGYYALTGILLYDADAYLY